MKSELKELLRRDFGAFLAKVFAELGGTLPEPGPYLRLLVACALSVALGNIKRGLLNVPPRHGKTQTFSIALVAWMLGHNPRLQVMLLSYGEALSHDIASKLRRILQSAWFQELFPTRLSDSRYAVMDFATTKGGHVYASSFGGAITGRGADLIIIDDPVKISDAAKLDVHDKVADSVEMEVLSRLNNRKQGQVLIVGHRLHPEDVFSRYEKDPSWTKLSLPFIADEPMTHEFGSEVWEREAGELLRPDGFSEDDVRTLRNNPQFEALYQQNPAGVPWDPLTEEDFPPYARRVPEEAPLVISIDPSQAANDRASHWVAQAWALVEDRYVLVDQVRSQSGYEGMTREAFGFANRHRPSLILIEQTAGGLGLAERLRRTFANRIVVIAAPTDSKLERLGSCIEAIRLGKVMIGSRAIFRSEFIDEVTSFPGGNATDQVDAMTQFLNFIRNEPIVPDRYQRAVVAAGTGSGIGLSGSPSQVAVTSDGRALAVMSRQTRRY